MHFSRPLPRPSVGKHYPRAVLRCSYPAVLANGVTHGPFSRSTALLSRTSSSRSPGQRTGSCVFARKDGSGRWSRTIISGFKAPRATVTPGRNESGRSDRICTCDLTAPNGALLN